MLKASLDIQESAATSTAMGRPWPCHDRFHTRHSPALFFWFRSWPFKANYRIDCSHLQVPASFDPAIGMIDFRPLRLKLPQHFAGDLKTPVLYHPLTQTLLSFPIHFHVGHSFSQQLGAADFRPRDPYRSFSFQHSTRRFLAIRIAGSDLLQPGLFYEHVSSIL